MGRFELKYPFPEADVEEVRDILSCYMATDQYSARGDGAYTVRSIYFDTPNLDAYHEKIAGICHRRKVRVRGYDKPNGRSKVFLEVKRKDDMIVSKARAAVPYADIDRLFVRGSPSGLIPCKPCEQEDANEFLYNVRRRAMRPVVLVTYDRIAFVAHTGSPLRVTIDWNIRAEAWPRMSDLYSDVVTHEVFPGRAVLEVKFPTRMPLWVETLVDRRKLEREAVSKYALGIEVCGMHLNTIGPVRPAARERAASLAGVLERLNS